MFNLTIPVIAGIQCMWGWGSEFTVSTVTIVRDFWSTTLHCSVRQWSNWNRDNCYSGRWIARAIELICSINKWSISSQNVSIEDRHQLETTPLGTTLELYPHIETFWKPIVRSLMLQNSSMSFAILWSNWAWLSLWHFLYHNIWMLPQHVIISFIGISDLLFIGTSRRYSLVYPQNFRSHILKGSITFNYHLHTHKKAIINTHAVTIHVV